MVTSQNIVKALICIYFILFFTNYIKYNNDLYQIKVCKYQNQKKKKEIVIYLIRNCKTIIFIYYIQKRNYIFALAGSVFPIYAYIYIFKNKK